MQHTGRMHMATAKQQACRPCAIAQPDELIQDCNTHADCCSTRHVLLDRLLWEFVGLAASTVSWTTCAHVCMAGHVLWQLHIQTGVQPPAA